MLTILQAVARRTEREHNGRAWLAWNTAALMRAKRMPPFKSLLIRRRGLPQTWQQQLHVARMITAAYGGND